MTCNEADYVVVLDLKAHSKGHSPSDLPISDFPEGLGREMLSEAAPESAFNGVELARHLLAAVQRHVLAGDSFNDLSEKTEQIQEELRFSSDEPALRRSAESLNAVLAAFQSRVQENNRETAISFQKILSFVNESFSCIQAGNQKSDTRLKYFENSLGQAAKIESLAGLRHHLSGMLNFVQQEGKRDLREKETKFSAMADQLRQVHAESAQYRLRLRGRGEAIDYLGDLLRTPDEMTDYRVTLFTVEPLRALYARHGAEVANNILEELGRKHIQPLAEEGKLFCWSGTSLVFVWHHSFGSTSPALLNPVPTLFEHRAFLGSRVATFKLTIRPFTTPLAGDIDDIVAFLDRPSNEEKAS